MGPVIHLSLLLPFYSPLISLLLPFFPLFPFQILSALADAHQIHARKDEDDGYGLTPSEYAQPCDGTYETSHRGLDVIVYAHHGGTQHLLCANHQDVGEESSEEHHEARLEPGPGAYFGKRNGVEMPERERQDDKAGIGEGPFHNRHDMIALHDVLEESQIDGETALCTHHQQVAEDVAFGFGTSCRRAAQDQYQRSRHAQGNAQHLLRRDGLPQDDGSQYHRDDGHRCGHDAGIGGRCDAESDGIAALVADDAEHGHEEELEQIARRHLLLLLSRHLEHKRSKPEAQTSTHDAKTHHVDAPYAVQHGVLPDGRHQSPDDAGTADAQMRQDNISFH